MEQNREVNIWHSLIDNLSKNNASLRQTMEYLAENGYFEHPIFDYGAITLAENNQAEYYKFMKKLYMINIKQFHICLDKSPFTNLIYLERINDFVIRNEAKATSTSKNIPKSSMDTPQLSEDAIHLLVEASQDYHGQIIVMPMLGGAKIFTNKKPICNAGMARELAKWKGAIRELVHNNLIELVGEKDEIYQMTSHGYQIADYYINLSDSTNE